MNLFELYHVDIVTSLLFGGMLVVMLISFPLVTRRLKKEHRTVFFGYILFHCSSFYFLFSGCLPTRIQLLGIYWDIPAELHMALFGVTWFLSIGCLVRLIYKLTKDSKA